MAIRPTPQNIIDSAYDVAVQLEPSGGFGRGTMSVLVAGTPRAFTLSPAVPPALEQSVVAPGTITVAVQAGWGTSADKGKEFVVSVTAGDDTTTSDPVIIR